MHTLKRLAILSVVAMVLAFSSLPAFAEEVALTDSGETDVTVISEEVDATQPTEESVVEPSDVVEEEVTEPPAAPAEPSVSAGDSSLRPAVSEEDQPVPADEPAAQEDAPLGATAPEQDDVPLTARERGTGWYVDGSTLYITGTVPDWMQGDDLRAPWYGVDGITSVVCKKGAKVYTCCGMFTLRYNEIASIDLRNLNTSQVTDFSMMFSGCTSLTSVNLSGLDTSKATDFSYMFYTCRKLKSVDLSGLDASKVKDFSHMFEECASLATVGLGRLKATSGENVIQMFAGCSSLTSADLSPFRGAPLQSTADMFFGCSSLASADLTPLKDAPLQSTAYMFSGCSSLTSVNLSALKGKSLYMAGMLYGCLRLKSVDFSDITVVSDSRGQLGTEGVMNDCANLESFTIPAEWPMTGVKAHTLGGGYWLDANDSIPAATASNGKWWSVKAKRWFTVDQIRTQRAGIADTYKNDDGTGAYVTVPIFRMYNTLTSEHLYTTSAKEYASCGLGSYADWRAEGVAWRAPKKSSKPVYRLYNVKSGDHHYTTSSGERSKLLASGAWRDEGVAFYSATKGSAGAIPLYRVYNGRLKRGQHHYTRSAGERDALVSKHGWRNEGVGFYGYKA